MRPETLTNVFWGVFLIWFGVVAARFGGNFGATINSPEFALGTGILLLVMNLVRSIQHTKVSPLTVGLGAILTVIYSPLVILGIDVPFLPALLIILGIALVIGALRTREFF